MAKFSTLAVAAAAAALLPAAALAAPTPVTGSIAGPVVSVHGSTLVVSSTQVPGGKANVHAGKTTVIQTTVTATRANVKKGACVVAMGQKGKNGVVTAQRVSLRTVPKGQKCDAFPGRRQGGTPPTRTGTIPRNGTPPPGGFRGNFANFGFAAGSVTFVKNTTIRVKGQNGTTTVRLSKTTQISRTIRIKAAAVHAKECAFVRGTSTDKGVNVKAAQIQISVALNGTCNQPTFGRGGP